MSAKKSFDVRRSAGVKETAQKQRRIEKPPRKHTPRSRRQKTLRERREAAKQVRTMFVGALCLCVLGGVIYGLWRPQLRITDILVSDVRFEESIQVIAQKELSGTYYHIFPRDSFLLFPEKALQSAIAEEHPSIAKITIARTGFDSLMISLESRDTAFWWCGLPTDAGSVSDSCFDADKEGFVFLPHEESQDNASSTHMLRVYAVLETASSTHSYPLGSRVLGTENIDDILRFSHTLEALSIPLRSIAIRGDEADVYTEGGTRITYVVGKEREAAEDAKITLPKLNLLDGSIQYVDLRFPGKVYLKRGE